MRLHKFLVRSERPSYPWHKMTLKRNELCSWKSEDFNLLLHNLNIFHLIWSFHIQTDWKHMISEAKLDQLPAVTPDKFEVTLINYLFPKARDWVMSMDPWIFKVIYLFFSRNNYSNKKIISSSIEVNFQLFAVVSPCTRFVRFEIYGYDVRGNFGLHRELEKYSLE